MRPELGPDLAVPVRAGAVVDIQWMQLISIVVVNNKGLLSSRLKHQNVKA